VPGETTRRSAGVLTLDDGSEADGSVHKRSGYDTSDMTLTFHGGPLDGRTFEFFFDSVY
jgi:hypothetical protein